MSEPSQTIKLPFRYFVTFRDNAGEIATEWTPDYPYGLFSASCSLGGHGQRFRTAYEKAKREFQAKVKRNGGH